MARRSPPRKGTYFEPVLPSLARATIIGSTFADRPPLPLHDARRLRPRYPRNGTRVYPSASTEEELARWPQRGLSTRRSHDRRASRSPTHKRA